jgi:hypothetical protein
LRSGSSISRSATLFLKKKRASMRLQAACCFAVLQKPEAEPCPLPLAPMLPMRRASPMLPPAPMLVPAAPGTAAIASSSLRFFLIAFLHVCVTLSKCSPAVRE